MDADLRVLTRGPDKGVTLQGRWRKWVDASALIQKRFCDSSIAGHADAEKECDASALTPKSFAMVQIRERLCKGAGARVLVQRGLCKGAGARVLARVGCCKSAVARALFSVRRRAKLMQWPHCHSPETNP